MTRQEQLDEARLHLKAWLDAELRVSSGQEFSMGTRRLAMPDLPYISERIGYWRREVSKLSPGGGGHKRTFHIVPLDL